MIKILTRVPHPSDGVSFYRGFGPLGHLRTIMDVEFQQCAEFNWNILSQCDGLYMVRPATDADVSILLMAQNCRKPVWIDYDDHVLAIPKSNPGFSFYANEKVRENIRILLKQADHVSVSTKFLKKEFSKYRDRLIHHIPNALPTNLLDWRGEDVPRKKLVTWRGSRTHDKDLKTMHPFLTQLQQDLPEWDFLFFGEIDYQTYDLFDPKRIKVQPFSDVMEYFHALKRSGSSIHLVALEDNDFNRSKSNIAWMEAAWAGSQVIFNQHEFEEWAVPGILYQNQWPEFYKEFLTTPQTKVTPVGYSREFVEKNLLISNTNEIRKKIVLSMAAQWQNQ